MSMYINKIKNDQTIQTNTQYISQKQDNSKNVIENTVENTTNIVTSNENAMLDNEITEDTPDFDETNYTHLDKETAEKLSLELINKYYKLYDYENSSIGPSYGILCELGLETAENLESLYYEDATPQTYVKSNVKYEDFKEKMLEYVSEKYFENRFSQYKNMDGYVGFCFCGGGSILYKAVSSTLESINGNIYTFNVVINDVEENHLSTKKIHFKHINDKLVISKWEN